MAGISLGTGLLGARQTHHYALVTSLQNERRAVYARLIAICDQFDDVNYDLTSAESDHAEAARLRDSGGVGAAERERRQRDFDKVDERLKTAAVAHDALLDAFRDARSTALLVASAEVAEKLKALLKVFQQDSKLTMNEARNAFLRAGMTDLVTARRPAPAPILTNARTT